MKISQEISKKTEENSPFENDKDNNDNSITYYMEDKNIKDIENENDIIKEDNEINKNNISKEVNKLENKNEKINEEQIKKSKNSMNEEEEYENEEENEENKNNGTIDEEFDSKDLFENTFKKRHFMEETISFKNKIEKSYKKKLNVSAKNPKEFDDYLIRLEKYNSKRNEQLEKLKHKCYLKEKKKCTNIPYINKKSKELANNNLSFLERLKNEQERTKLKKKQLEEQIIIERKRKKEEELKRNDYKIKKTKIDEKWNKRLNEMNKIQKKHQEKFEQIKKRVKDEEMKEYIFQPKINSSKMKNTKTNSINNSETNNIKTKHKRPGSAVITNRLYNDDLLKRKENKDILIKKYTPSFQPKIDEKSKNMKLNRKKNEFMYRYLIYNKTNYDFHNNSCEKSNGQSYTNTQWNIHNKLDDSEDEKSEDSILDNEHNNNKKNKDYKQNLEIQEIDEEEIDDVKLNNDEINDNIKENKNNE